MCWRRWALADKRLIDSGGRDAVNGEPLIIRPAAVGECAGIGRKSAGPSGGPKPVLASTA